jgi:hypothetical protein
MELVGHNIKMKIIVSQKDEWCGMQKNVVLAQKPTSNHTM